MRKKSIFSLVAGLTAAVTLASCSNLNPDLPLNYGDTVLTIIDEDGNEVDVPFNYNRQLYDDIGEINAYAVNSIMDYIAAQLTAGNLVDEDGETLHLYSSEVGEDSSVSYSIPLITGVDDDGNFIYDSYEYYGVSDEITQRTQQTMLDAVNAGTYDYLNVFDEMNYVLSLNSASLAQIDSSLVQNTLDKGIVVNSNSDFEDVFTPEIYDDYMHRRLASSVVENMLTAQYIYNRRYSSIVNAGFRNVSIVALTDRDDDKGAAQSLINAYYDDYITQDETIDERYAETPLEELAALWKGYNSDGSALTTDQQEWLDENGLVNLLDQIDDEISRIHLDNPLLTDSDLQDEYTGSGSYSVEEGRVRAVNSLKKEDIYYAGVYQSDDLSDLPSDVTDQIFAANISRVLFYPADNPETEEVEGKAYITPSTTVNDPDAASTITIYDSSSDTYYLAMIDEDDVYNSATLGTRATNVEDENLRSIAMDVAYEMNADSTYRTDAVVYWIETLVGDGKLVVRNETFYDYLEENYPDLFDD